MSNSIFPPLPTFAATPSSVGQKLLLYIATKKKWTVCIGDVSTAFLHAPLGEGERVYVRPLPNLRKEGVVWRLMAALYSLRAAPRLFQEYMEKVLLEHGRRRFASDPQLYQHIATGALISVHADDILIAAPQDRVQEIRELMETGLKIKWGEDITEHQWTRYLGKEWRRTPKGFEMRIPQRCVNALLELARLERAKGVNTPAIPGRGGGSEEEKEQLDEACHHRYVPDAGGQAHVDAVHLQAALGVCRE